MKNPIRSLSLISAIAAGLSASAVQAQTVVTYDKPAADTYVSVAAPGANYGSEGTWKTRFSANNSSQRLGYVRFDLKGLLTGPVQNATLTVTYTGRTQASETEAIINIYGVNPDYTVPVGKLGADWDESELTNENAVWAASGNGTKPAYITLLGAFTISVDPAAAPGSTYSITGTALASFLETFRANEDNHVTFIFRSTTGTFFSFASKENTDENLAPASLTVTMAQSGIPEASSFAVIAGGAALAFCSLSRRKRAH